MSPGSGLVENVLRHIHPGVEGGTQWRGSALQIDPLKGGLLRHGLVTGLFLFLKKTSPKATAFVSLCVVHSG